MRGRVPSLSEAVLADSNLSDIADDENETPALVAPMVMADSLRKFRLEFMFSADSASWLAVDAIYIVSDIKLGFYNSCLKLGFRWPDSSQRTI